MTRRRTPSPEPPENRNEPERPSAPPPGAPGLRNATEALPEDADRLYGNLDADPRAADWLRPWVREGFASYEEWAKEQER